MDKHLESSDGVGTLSGLSHGHPRIGLHKCVESVLSAVLAVTPLGAVLAGSLIGASPFGSAAHAETIAASAPVSTMSDARRLRQLDIMLMVTGLRCRNTADDFQADYLKFEANHQAEFDDANRTLLAAYQTRMGAVAASRALDEMSTATANHYGNGHPWLECADLKALAHSLVTTSGRADVIEIASEVLDGDPGLAGGQRFADARP